MTDVSNRSESIKIRVSEKQHCIGEHGSCKRTCVCVFLCMLCARVCVSCRHGLSNHLPSVFLSVCQEKPSTSLHCLYGQPTMDTHVWRHTDTHTHTAHSNHLPLIRQQWTITHKHVNTHSYILSDLDIELGAIYKSLTDLADIQRLREVYVVLWSRPPYAPERLEKH